MEVRCSLCGTKVELTKIHKDYDRLARDPKGTFVCNQCHARVKYQAEQQLKTPKPI